MTSRANTKTVARTFLLFLFVFLTLLPGSAVAGKTVEATWGTKALGTLGGQFSTATDIAVDEATGRVYVADTGNNRIQRFDSNGNFEIAWGWDVVRAGGTGDVLANERQTVEVNATSGNFVLDFSRPQGLTPAGVPGNTTTGPIAQSATAAGLRTALEALPNLDPGEVAVTGLGGGPWEVEFIGPLANVDISQMRARSVDLGGDPIQLRVITTVQGAGFELCTVASECKAGTSNGQGGAMDNPKAIVLDPATGHLFVREGARITEFDPGAATPAGMFVRSSGWNVVQAGAAGNVAGNEQQILTIRDTVGRPPVGGSFELEWRLPEEAGAFETGSLPHDASAAQVEAALEALPVLAPEDISVTGPAGGPWTVAFVGEYADEDVAPIRGVGGQDGMEDLVPETPFTSTGSGIYFQTSIATVVRDGGSHEACVASADCQRGVAGGGASAGAAGQLSNTFGDTFLVRDPSSGDLYTGGLLRTNHYEADGDFIRAFGWGVETGADQFEVCTTASGCQPGRRPPATDPPTFPLNGQFESDPSAAAIGSAGVLYVARRYDGDLGAPANGKVLITRFDTTASVAPDVLLPDPIVSSDPIGPCNYCTPGPLEPRNRPVGLEIDPDSGHLFYLNSFDVGKSEILELDTSIHPATVVDTHIPNANAVFGGLGIDDARGRLYASVADSDVGHRIIVISDTPASAATVTIDPVAAIGVEGATFSGSVTPNGPPGIDTTYRFEYSLQGSGKWKAVPVPDENLGDGSSPIAVSKTVADLDPNAAYLVRLVASKGLGLGSVTSQELQFTTLKLPPTAKTVFPRARTATWADLAGVVDANNLPTSYRFEYGETAAYGTSVPVPNGTVNGPAPRAVLERIEGLKPDTTYHYRIVATSSEGTAIGDDVAFTTRSVVAPPAGRAYEMVTPPFKVVRSPVGQGAEDGNNPNPGVPSLDGESIVWNVPFFPLSDAVGWPDSGDKRIIRRTPTGWVHETMNTLPLLTGYAVLQSQDVRATSGDLETAAWGTVNGVTSWEHGSLLPTEGPVANRLYTRRFGTGVEGFTPWLTNPAAQVQALGTKLTSYDSFADEADRAVLNDDGSAMARWGLYGGLAEDPATPEDDDPSDNGIDLKNPLGGRMIYSQRASDPDQMPIAPKDLVNECTKGPLPATQIPRINSNLIGVQGCPPGRPLTSPRGAVVGGGSLPGGRPGAGAAATALSADGNRIFFESPDPETAPTTCSGINSTTSCPPQLYVRQYGSEGQAAVRWISHSRSISNSEGGFTGMATPNQLIANQPAAMMGAGVTFQGASRSGDVVYFQTNAPLVPSDPNDGLSDGAADASWDLYRYELPPGLDEDPDAGTLTRITGGPDDTADANANGREGGGSARFVSDEGNRAYFVTKAPIAGADLTPPTGGATTPGGTATNTTTRNLYLFDAEESGAERYRFVAQLPFSSGGFAACASTGGVGGSGMLSSNGVDVVRFSAANCFRGTADGRHVVFATDGQLTGDDTDAAADLYLFNADSDELIRVSAPPVGAGAYTCVRVDPRGPSEGECNADYGFSPPGFQVSAFGSGDTGRGWGGFRYTNIAYNPDGSVSVYFESRAELLAADDNGTHWDVYEWHGGELRLLSRALAGHHSYFSGNSTDGEDVFIWTTDPIDPRELDDASYDLYDVRRGSQGFPFAPPATPCDVLGLKCEAAALPAPRVGGPSTGSPHGSGNLPTKRAKCPKGKVRRKQRCVKRKAKAGKRRTARKRGGRQ
jgi:hypothetical protein